MLRMILITFVSFSLHAAPVTLTDWNYELTDVASVGMSKETLFSNMSREIVKIGGSICSNPMILADSKILKRLKCFSSTLEKQEKSVARLGGITSLR